MVNNNNRMRNLSFHEDTVDEIKSFYKVDESKTKLKARKHLILREYLYKDYPKFQDFSKIEIPDGYEIFQILNHITDGTVDGYSMFFLNVEPVVVKNIEDFGTPTVKTYTKGI